jgi:hypothetical protein
MRTIVFTLILFKALLSQSGLPKVEQISDSNIVWIFNNLEILKVQETPKFILKIFAIDDEVDSTATMEVERTTQIYVGLSEYGEIPLQKLYRLESLYSPRLETMEIAGDAIIILFSYIELGERISTKVIYSLRGASILKPK